MCVWRARIFSLLSHTHMVALQAGQAWHSPDLTSYFFFRRRPRTAQHRWLRLLSTQCSAGSDSHRTNLAIKSQRKEGLLCKSHSARHSLKLRGIYTPRNTAEGNIIQFPSFSGHRALCQRAALWRKRLVFSACTLTARSRDTSPSSIRDETRERKSQKRCEFSLCPQARRNRRWSAKGWTTTRWSRTATAILTENHRRTRGPVTPNRVHLSEYRTNHTQD